jgi:hypothetical protein
MTFLFMSQSAGIASDTLISFANVELDIHYFAPQCRKYSGDSEMQLFCLAFHGEPANAVAFTHEEALLAREALIGAGHYAAGEITIRPVSDIGTSQILSTNDGWELVDL